MLQKFNIFIISMLLNNVDLEYQQIQNMSDHIQYNLIQSDKKFSEFYI